jgi:hypothetical protein
LSTTLEEIGIGYSVTNPWKKKLVLH